MDQVFGVGDKFKITKWFGREVNHIAKVTEVSKEVVKFDPPLSNGNSGFLLTMIPNGYVRVDSAKEID